MSNKNQKISRKLEKYNQEKPTRMMATNIERQKKLRELVDLHGLSSVALASGLTQNTLKQYIRVSLPQSISQDAIDQAEHILEGLEETKG